MNQSGQYAVLYYRLIDMQVGHQHRLNFISVYWHSQHRHNFPGAIIKVAGMIGTSFDFILVKSEVPRFITLFLAVVEGGKSLEKSRWCCQEKEKPMSKVTVSHDGLYMTRIQYTAEYYTYDHDLVIRKGF